MKELIEACAAEGRAAVTPEQCEAFWERVFELVHEQNRASLVLFEPILDVIKERISNHRRYNSGIESRAAMRALAALLKYLLSRDNKEYAGEQAEWEPRYAGAIRGFVAASHMTLAADLRASDARRDQALADIERGILALAYPSGE